MRTHSGFRSFVLCMVALLSLTLSFNHAQARTESRSRYFAETRHTVGGRFLTYWEQHGGLMQFGFPLSEEIQERSETSDAPYTVQYFERAVFELHPEYQPQDQVQLSLLGMREYRRRYGCIGGLRQSASTDNPATFDHTGKTIGGRFRAYWEQRGGWTRFGYPISNEFQEKSLINGRTYTVQYFERAELEMHPENVGTPYEVLLSHLGALKLQHKDMGKVPANTLIVWGDNTHSCSTCERDILAKDPITGQVFPIATGPTDQAWPIAYGRTVAWLEATQEHTSIMIENLDDGVVKVVARDAWNAELDGLSAEYLVWVEVKYHSGGRLDDRPNELRAYNLRTGEVIGVASLIPPFGYEDRVLDMEGHRVVWSDQYGIKARDLDSGESWDISPDFNAHIELKGDMVTWANYYGFFVYDLARREVTKIPPCKEDP